MSIIVNIGIFGLNILYFFMKCLPVQNKITYISRQMDVTPLDFQMIIDETKKAGSQPWKTNPWDAPRSPVPLRCAASSHTESR